MVHRKSGANWHDLWDHAIQWKQKGKALVARETKNE